MPGSFSVDIPRDARGPAVARRAIERCSDGVSADVVPDVKLLVTELITNSIKYGGGSEVRLSVSIDAPHRLRVEVADQGDSFLPAARVMPTTDAGGWGLHLVNELSDRWGIREGLNHVWFEIDRP